MDENQIKQSLHEKASHLTPMEVPEIEQIMLKKQRKKRTLRPIWTAISTAVACIMLATTVQLNDSPGQPYETNTLRKEAPATTEMTTMALDVPHSVYIRLGELQDDTLVGEKLGTNTQLGYTLENIREEVEVYALRQSQNIAICMDGKWYRFGQKSD